MEIQLFLPLAVSGVSDPELYHGLMTKRITSEYYPKPGDKIKDPFLENETDIERIVINVDNAGKCTYEVHLMPLSVNWKDSQLLEKIKHSPDQCWNADDPLVKNIIRKYL
jgi:hypothetical protein